MQNRSNAVMATRVEANDSLDDFPTPSWAARALFEHVLSPSYRGLNIWEPAANRGSMAKGLQGYAAKVLTTDVHDYGVGFPTFDFLWPGTKCHDVDFIITNPPFRLAEQFIHKAMAEASVGCAMLVRTQFLEGCGRYETLFGPMPPTQVAFFAERVPMVKGRVDPKASTATSYSWLVWMRGFAPKPPMWIPPCRKLLERPGDYSL